MAIEDGERSEFEGTLEYVAARWREADRGTLRHAFPLLARGRPGCEVLAFPALVLGRRTHLACLLFSPIDWVEGKVTEMLRGSRA